MLLYVILLAGSVAMSALLTVWVRSTAVAYGLKATPVYGRHTHTKPLPRLGGIAICVTFMTAALAYIPIARFLHVEISVRNYLGILVPVMLIFFMGAYDALPKNANGKIDRPRLKDAFARNESDGKAEETRGALAAGPSTSKPATDTSFSPGGNTSQV